MIEKSFEELLVEGSKNKLTLDIEETNKPLVIRGVVKKNYAEECVKINRDFYYMDTGYVGNFPSPGNPNGKKKWHRVVKNENQHSIIREVPDDRWKQLIKDDPRLAWSEWKNYNKKILLVMPNPKACKYYNIDFNTWEKETIEKIKTYSNLPIEIRIKGSRSERNTGYTIYDAFDSGVYATVALNSVAAVESVLYGIPAFVSVPCAALPIASTDLSMLKNPYKPTQETINKQACNLSYGQFTVEEIADGTAYKLIEKYTI